MSDVEANLSRLGHAVDRVVESCIDLEAEGGVEAAMARWRPSRRQAFLERLEQARDSLDALLDAARGSRGRADRPVPTRHGLRLPGRG